MPGSTTSSTNRPGALYEAVVLAAAHAVADAADLVGGGGFAGGAGRGALGGAHALAPSGSARSFGRSSAAAAWMALTMLM